MKAGAHILGADRDRFVVGASLATAVAMLVGLGFRYSSGAPLFRDEATTAIAAVRAFPGFLDTITTGEPNFALYYSFMRLWTALFGAAEPVLRLPSLLFAVASVWVTFRLGRRLWGPSAGAMAALLLSANRLVVIQSQNARPYTLVMLLLVLGIDRYLTFAEATDVKTPSGWIWFSISIAAILAHTAAVVAILVQLVHYVFVRERHDVRATDNPARRRLPAPVRALLLLTIIGGLVVTASGITGRIDWIPELSRGRALRVFDQISIGPGLVWAWIMTGLGVVGIVVAGLRERRARGHFDRTLLIGLSWLVPIAVLCGISVVLPTLVDRYLIVTAPAAAMASAAALSSVRPRALGWLMLCVILTFGIRDATSTQRVDSVARYPEALEVVGPEIGPGDLVVAGPAESSSARWYLSRSGIREAADVVGFEQALRRGPGDLLTRSSTIWILGQNPARRSDDFSPFVDELSGLVEVMSVDTIAGVYIARFESLTPIAADD